MILIESVISINLVQGGGEKLRLCTCTVKITKLYTSLSTNKNYQTHPNIVYII